MNSLLLRAALGAFSFSLVLPCFAALPGAQSETFDLFTPAEAVAWNTKSAHKPERSIGAPGEVSCHSPPAAASAATNPQIKILAPTLDKPLNAPIDIEVQFVPAG